jgi:hypothetical protein
MGDVGSGPWAAEHRRWLDQCAQDAASLVGRFGADGIEWLDTFLADYVFLGEPLDRVLVKARELSGLPVRPHRRPAFDDD